MSESLINQITLDCLLNKKMYNNQIKNNKTKQINHEERKFYRKRIYNLFKDMISENSPDNLLLDVKLTAIDVYVFLVPEPSCGGYRMSKIRVLRHSKPLSKV